MPEFESGAAACILLRHPDNSGVEIVNMQPDPAPADYRGAMKLAEATAEAAIGEHMLLSWYDRDRNFEAPQHTSECNQPGATPGYVEYGLSHGAKLMVDICEGRFVFFFLPMT
ncbi:MAG: AF1514 family protein [Thiobacillaceae bacterium]